MTNWNIVKTLIFAPLMGLAFCIFLPFLGFAMVFYCVGKLVYDGVGHFHHQGNLG